MKDKSWIKKLKILESIDTYDWDTTRKMIDRIKLSSTEILEIEDHRDSYHQEYDPITRERLTEENNKDYSRNLWCTYDKCRQLEIQYDTDSTLIGIFHIYEGNNYDGYPHNLRFIAKIKTDIAFLSEIRKDIAYAFANHLEMEYEKHLQKQKETWMHNKMILLLKD